jgi:hypothetical protein
MVSGKSFCGGYLRSVQADFRWFLPGRRHVPEDNANNLTAGNSLGFFFKALFYAQPTTP